jgi:hypothetical protein
MRYLGVESIIVSDTYNGIPLSQYSVETSSRTHQFASFFNQQVRKSEGPKSLQRLQATFREYCPWLAYYLKGMAIPVGTTSTFEGRKIVMKEPNERIMEQCLAYFANGAEDITYDGAEYFPDNFIIGDATSDILTPSAIDDMAEKYHKD